MRSSEFFYNHPENVTESIKLMIGGEPEVLFLMSGGIAEKNGSLIPTRINDGDRYDGFKYGYLGGVYRMLAAEQLAKMFPEAKIVTNSRDHKTHESHALAYKDALIRRGIDGDRIILQEQSETTRGEFRELIGLALTNNWKGQITLVTNDYHIERAKLTMDLLDQVFDSEDDANFRTDLQTFKERGIKVSFANAERILETVNPLYKKFFKRINDEDPLASLIRLRNQSELNGVNALKSKSYQKRF